jgi:hypothetical protein
MLKSVVLSSGRERRFDYDGILMSRIADENGHVLVRNWYRQRFLQKQQFGNGGVYWYSYDWPEEEYFPRKVGITLPDGTLAGIVRCRFGPGIRQELSATLR